MNGGTAKKIRRAVYGDNSQRGTKYIIKSFTRTLVCTGLRKAYKVAKKAYREEYKALKAA